MLNHPNIIKYRDFIKTDDFYIIVMDYADGGDLR